MNEQIKQCWIEALRSGEYQQTQGYLRTDTGYCCLGVLTDLYIKETGEKWTDNGCSYTFCGSNSFLPQCVVDWADLESCFPRIAKNDGQFNYLHCMEDLFLASINDKGKSFEEIADLIETGTVS